MTLEQAFQKRLTNTPCVYINLSREVWVATEMCAQYLESVIDSLVVRNDQHEPVGIVGGYDILDTIRKNSSRDFQYEHKVEDIMFKDFLIVEKNTKISDLVEKWKQTRRAFAITKNDFGGFSPISVRKMLELGVRIKTDKTISSLPPKNIVTFEADESLGSVLEKMFKNNTRKLLLEYSNKFISDRLILQEISNVLKFRTDIDDLLEIPVKEIELQETKTLKTDLRLDQLCSLMYEMEQPYVVYKDITVSPWDVTLTLLSEELKDGDSKSERITCPHCGNDFPL